MKETIEKLASMRSCLQKICLATFAGIIIALVLILAWQKIPGVLLEAAILIFYFGWLRGQIRQYSDEANKAHILHGLATPLRNPVYLGKTGLTVNDLDEMAMLPIRKEENGLLIREGFEGKKDSGICRGWETTFHYSLGSGNKNVAFLSGTLMTKTYDQVLPETPDWLAVRREMVDGDVLKQFFKEEKYQEKTTGNDLLDRKFLIGVRGEGTLSESILPRLAGLCEKQQRIGAIRCYDQQAAVFLDHRFYTARLKVRDLPTEDQLRTNPLPERDDVWEFFQFLQRWREEKE